MKKLIGLWVVCCCVIMMMACSKQSSETKKVDEVAQEINGNTNGNLRNGGFVATYEDKIYYVTDSYKTLVCEDGEDAPILLQESMIQQLNVIQDKIYYVGQKGVVKQVDLDGTNEQIVYTPDTVGNQMTCIVDKENIYYAYSNEQVHRLVRIAINSKEVMTLSEECNGMLSLYEGYLYFGTYDTNEICKMELAGTNQSNLNVISNQFIVHQGYLFYITEKGDLSRCNLEGKKTKTIHKGQVYQMNAWNDTLMIIDKNRNAVGMNLNGKNDSVISVYTINQIGIVNQLLYIMDEYNVLSVNAF